MTEIINWLTKTTPGIAVLILVLIVVFIIIAALSERKTRKLFPDQTKRKSK
ncbi:MAG: hypothetical protein FWD45_03900 [Coriobacteriia bacterium]|nr:hypothetical protein [Coriobacteriia bacterium]